ncbi:hypothetical protein TIFTF001_009471 [Ficus carica]|uniref:Sulfite exporter TauE/SafE family protein n=1 Tax=Ficus carica TaxID=3494 RepID=A0AA87ZUQ0_FICCA|nr:hypothetical protein TIFTF001_009471 [Ficus carica]
MCTMRLMGILVFSFLVFASSFGKGVEGYEVEPDHVTRASNTASQLTLRSGSGYYHHVWPEMKLDWKIVVGGLIGLLGSAFGSVGGAGGGGIFVPMLTLIVGFDQKSSTALSKCMIFGGATATVFYNLRRRHQTLGCPVIDYDLALLFQPMQILGISIGVALNVLFAEWMIILLLVIVFLATAIRSFLKGMETWEKETIIQKEMISRIQAYCESNAGTTGKEIEIKNSNPVEFRGPNTTKVSIYENICWKELVLLIALWILILILQIAKDLFFGTESHGDLFIDVLATKFLTGGGVILGPLFLDLGIPIEVSSATVTLILTFSSSMSVVEYYLLKRFPIPYALYFAAVSTISAILGQSLVGKVIRRSGRTSVIIFILASMMIISAIALGGVGIAHSIEKIRHKEYMGFENICAHTA